MASLKIEESVPLKLHTTLDVGGPANFFVEVRSKEELKEALKFADGKSLPSWILGGGSNVVISDEGFKGLVIKNKILGTSFKKDGEMVRVEAGAGEVWDSLVQMSVERDLQGIENISGVPGAVGATPVQNVGCYGQSVDETILEVKVIDRNTLEETTFDNQACKFSYRHSLFKSEPGRYVVLGVVFGLRENSPPSALGYADLKSFFKDLGRKPTLSEVRRAVFEIRAKKGMVIDPNYESFKSVGSFFMNPIIPRVSVENIADKIEGKSREIGREGAWRWDLDGQKQKVSAARLIECAGFSRGHREGTVGISPKHTLAILNYGGSTSLEIVSFARSIQERVKNLFGILLEAEPQFVGFDKPPLI